MIHKEYRVIDVDQDIVKELFDRRRNQAKEKGVKKNYELVASYSPLSPKITCFSFNYNDNPGLAFGIVIDTSVDEFKNANPISINGSDKIIIDRTRKSIAELLEHELLEVGREEK